MRITCFLVLLLLPFIKGISGQNLRSTLVESKGQIISIAGIDFSKYDLLLEDIEDAGPITLDVLLCFAVSECDREMVLELLDRGANANTRCEEETIHLMIDLAYCTENGVELAKILRAKGAELDVYDDEAEGFLSYAVGFDNLPLVRYLLENGADINYRDGYDHLGCLPINAVESVEMLKLLVSAGANTQDTCRNGRNLLHYAARKRLPELAAYLLEYQLTNPHQQDWEGKTPLDYAIRSGSKSVEAILRKQD